MHQQANHLPYLWGESIDEFWRRLCWASKVDCTTREICFSFGIKLYATHGFTFLCFSFLSFELNDLQNSLQDGIIAHYMGAMKAEWKWVHLQHKRWKFKECKIFNKRVISLKTTLKRRHLYQDLKDPVLEPHFDNSLFSIKNARFLLQVIRPPMADVFPSVTLSFFCLAL